MHFKLADNIPDGEYEVTVVANPYNDFGTWFTLFTSQGPTPLESCVPTVIPGKVKVGVNQTAEASYSVAPVLSDTNTTFKVGDTFEVGALVSADRADAGLAAVDAVLNYDKTLVKPTGAALGALTSESSTAVYDEDAGTGRIFANGTSVPVGESGVTVATYTFEAIAEGEAVFSIADGARVGQTGNPVDIDAAIGDPVTVTIESAGTAELISNDFYRGAAEGNQVLKYTAKAMPADGSAYFYGDTALLYTGTTEDGQYVFQSFVADSLTLDTLGKIEAKEGTYETVAHDGDVNLNSKVNAIDCLIAYDLTNGNDNYNADTSYELLSMRSRLEADMNNSGSVDSNDCRAIMNVALGLS